MRGIGLHHTHQTQDRRRSCLRFIALLLAALALLLMSTPARAAPPGQDLLGDWSCSGGSSLRFNSQSQGVLDGDAFNYRRTPEALLVEEDGGIVPYPYRLQQGRLLIQFPDGTALQCGRATADQASGGAPGGAPSGSPSSVEARLALEIAGIWWGYSGSTERKIGLCPGGVYMDYSESSYSGRSSDMYGNPDMAWGSASQNSRRGRWQLRGTAQSGAIAVQLDNGASFTLNYRQIGDPGCLSFNGNTLCRTSASCR
jgi:hypothetical protein